MIINCFRCGAPLESPDASNADYIIAEDTKTRETREVFVALKHNATTKAKKAKVVSDNTVTLEDGKKAPPTEDFIRNQFQDSEYDAVEVQSVEDARKSADTVKVLVELVEKDVPKTGIICPACHRPTDLVIWGVHRV